MTKRVNSLSFRKYIKLKMGNVPVNPFSPVGTSKYHIMNEMNIYYFFYPVFFQYTSLLILLSDNELHPDLTTHRQEDYQFNIVPTSNDQGNRL